MRPHIIVFSYRSDLLQLYDAVFGDENYEVSLAVPNMKNILCLGQKMPDLILVDITEEENPIDPFFLDWLQDHPLVPTLFCIDKYLQNTLIQRYIKEQRVSRLDKPFDIDVLIKKAEMCLHSKMAIS